MTLPHAWEKTPRLSRCASSSLTGSQPWAKTLNLDFGHGELAGGQMSLTIGADRERVPAKPWHPPSHAPAPANHRAGVHALLGELPAHSTLKEMRHCGR